MSGFSELRRGFREIFRLDKKIFLPLVYDLIFYFFSVLGVYFWYRYFLKSTSRLSGFDFSALTVEKIQSIEAARATLTKYLVGIIGTAFLLFIFILLLFAIFKGLIWLTYAGRRFSMRNFWVYLVLCAVCLFIGGFIETVLIINRSWWIVHLLFIFTFGYVLTLTSALYAIKGSLTKSFALLKRPRVHISIIPYFLLFILPLLTLLLFNILGLFKVLLAFLMIQVLRRYFFLTVESLPK